jgi:hypothetical protein
MSMLNLPPRLATPVVISGQVAAKVALDLTVYLVGPSEQDLEFLIDYYESLCPPGGMGHYSISELPSWRRVANPHLTASGRAAAAAGVKRPYLEPVRKRIREGRAFDVQFWDGRDIDDPDGCWGFRCARIHRRSSGLHAFVRILLPLTADFKILQTAAREIADHVEVYSGHGGLVFGYNPWLAEDAFDAIYAQARRFWGVDVEDLPGTLPLTRDGIKGVNWLTLVGTPLAAGPEIQAGMSALAKEPNVTIEQRQHGVIFTAGPQPVVGDQHRPDNSLDPYYAAAKALEPLFIKAHPDFPSERWVNSGKTIGWIRRFLDPAGWR